MILLDECVPRPFRTELPDYDIKTVPEMGWSGVTNGNLLRLAEEHFQIFITIDKNMRHQRNLTSTKLGIIILNTVSNRIDDLRLVAPLVLDVLQSIKPGDIVRIDG
jgi:Domain of unknown function (DUF5615)